MLKSVDISVLEILVLIVNQCHKILAENNWIILTWNCKNKDDMIIWNSHKWVMIMWTIWVLSQGQICKN